MDRKMVDFIKEQYPPGTRIRLNSMDDPYAPIAPGTEGEVDFVDDIGTIHMKWDNGRSLALIPGEDSFTVLPPKLTTLKLYMPLTADLYERNEYGDLDDSSTLLEGRELRGYQDQITAALVKNRMPEETERGLMHWYHMIQNLSRELFSVADEHDGRLQKRVVLFCDELGTMPPFDILPLFSAGRSRGLTLVPIIQSLAQLEKNYGKEGAEIICDNCQDTTFGGFSPQSKTAEALSTALGSRTVLSGSVSQGKESSQSLQMMERPLMTPDELKSIPKGEFVVMKTGTHPMRTRLRLFLDWGITFDPDGYRMPERAARKIAYVNHDELARSIQNRRENSPYNTEDSK